MAGEKRPDREAELDTKRPLSVKEQPDPFLQMSVGRIGAGGVTLFTIAVVLILTVVLYGLNGSNSGTEPNHQSVAANMPAPAAMPSAPAANAQKPAPTMSAPQPAAATPDAQQKGPGGNP